MGRGPHAAVEFKLPTELAASRANVKLELGGNLVLYARR